MSVAISNNSKQDQTCYDVLMGMSSKAVMAEWSARDQLFHFFGNLGCGFNPRTILLFFTQLFVPEQLQKSENKSNSSIFIFTET